MSPGEVVLHILSGFEERGLSYVYLRNYEGLPDAVGHDVDLLVARGTRLAALEALRQLAFECEWRVVRMASFSPLAVFLANETGGCSFHLDIFDRIERHWLEFGDADSVLGNRRHNGTVYIPSVGDEVFVNVCTRLVYLGMVRQKHKNQVSRCVEAGYGDEIRGAFERHLGKRPGSELANKVIAGDWGAVESSTGKLRVAACMRWGFGAPRRALAGLSRYVGRTIGRLLRPPGPFVVLEGADGVGKSTAIDGLVATLEEFTGIAGTVQFHWKPERRSMVVQGAGKPEARDPRGKVVRTPLTSLLYLAYHWLGFWYGWARWVYPALSRSRPVVADRYAFDLYLDPCRFRLSLPGWLLLAAVFLAPRPGLVIALVATPEVIGGRKTELGLEEISGYQSRLYELAETFRFFRIVDAEGPPSEVRKSVRDELIGWIESETRF